MAASIELYFLTQIVLSPRFFRAATLGSSLSKDQTPNILLATLKKREVAQELSIAACAMVILLGMGFKGHKQLIITSSFVFYF